MRLALAILAASSVSLQILDAAEGYVSPSACRPCHSEIYADYLRTGMGRSFSKAVSVPSGSYHHAASDRYYKVYEKDGRYFLRRRQLGYRGAETNVEEKEIHYVIGSGNHARTYAHRTEDGRLIELPLSWYSANGGSWAMSPGFDRPDHSGFRRELSDECLFCHNAYSAVAGGGTPEGIDCQRCHGPGELHARRASAGEDRQAVRTAILNPANLPAARQLEVCMQCHLESTSRPLPYSVRRRGRGIFSYRPGEPLAGYIIHFDHPRGGRHDDKFEVNHHAYRFRKSLCFLKSRETMTCTTCHNPHRIERGDTAKAHYRQVCRSCHTAEAEKLAGDSRHNASADCIACHMPSRRTEDAVHVVMTDHWIQRRPPERDLLTPLDELAVAREAAYSGEVSLYYPTRVEPVYVALAQVKDLSNWKQGIPNLERLLASLRSPEPEFYFELAEACRKAGQFDRAVRHYEKVLELEAAFVRAYSGLGESLLRTGKTKSAVSVLERGLKQPSANAELLNTFGVAYGQQGRIGESVRVLSRAVALRPDFPLAWVNLGVSLEHQHRYGDAEQAYRSALRAQPDLDRAHSHLANLLESTGRADEARYHRQKALPAAIGPFVR